MPEASYDVFISYRRESGAAEARLIQAGLQARGLRVFLDMTDLSKGYFDKTLLKRIDETPNFLLTFHRTRLIDALTSAIGCDKRSPRP